MTHSAEEIRKAFKDYMLSVVNTEGIFYVYKGCDPVTDELIAEIEDDWKKLETKQANCAHAYEYINSSFDNTQDRHVCKNCNKEKWIKHK